MFVEFNELPQESRVWVYPSNRKFYPQELDILNEKLRNFINEWCSNEGFKASFQLLYSRFLIFAIDDSVVVSTPIIDKKVQFIFSLQMEYNVDLLDKMNVCFKQGEHVQYKDLKEFKKLVKSRSVSKKTVVFDNLVQTKYELDNFWEVPITESWYGRILK